MLLSILYRHITTGSFMARGNQHIQLGKAHVIHEAIMERCELDISDSVSLFLIHLTMTPSPPLPYNSKHHKGCQINDLLHIQYLFSVT